VRLDLSLKLLAELGDPDAVKARNRATGHGPQARVHFELPTPCFAERARRRLRMARDWWREARAGFWVIR
jgi:hypothetical protein